MLSTLVLACAIGSVPTAAPNYDRDAEAALALAVAAHRTPVPLALNTGGTVSTVTTTRAPVGHTHTCPNGHTWDHAANPGHICQICGLSQFIQDPIARPVTVVARTSPLPVSGPVQSPEWEGVPLPTQSFTLPGATFGAGSGGCANGQCGSGGQTLQRGGLFGGGGLFGRARR